MNLSRKAKSDIIFWSILLLFAGYLFFTPSGSNTRAWLISLTLTSPSTQINEHNEPVTDDWYLFATDGSSVKLSEIKGKPIFINIWATWCPPCRGEMPSILELQQKYKDKVEFLIISPDEPLEKLQKFAHDNQYNAKFYNAEGYIPRELVVSSYPTTFILDKTKKIVLRSSGAHNWNSKSVHKLLDKLITP